MAVCVDVCVCVCVCVFVCVCVCLCVHVRVYPLILSAYLFLCSYPSLASIVARLNVYIGVIEHARL